MTFTKFFPIGSLASLAFAVFFASCENNSSGPFQAEIYSPSSDDMSTPISSSSQNIYISSSEQSPVSSESSPVSSFELSSSATSSNAQSSSSQSETANQAVPPLQFPSQSVASSAKKTTRHMKTTKIPNASSSNSRQAWWILL